MLLALCIVVLYFAPLYFARDKEDFWKIFLINLFFGWTVIGWAAALLLAISGEKDVQVYSTGTESPESQRIWKENLKWAEDFARQKKQPPIYRKVTVSEEHEHIREVKVCMNCMGPYYLDPVNYCPLCGRILSKAVRVNEDGTEVTNKVAKRSKKTGTKIKTLHASGTQLPRTAPGNAR